MKYLRVAVGVGSSSSYVWALSYKLSHFFPFFRYSYFRSLWARICFSSTPENQILSAFHFLSISGFCKGRDWFLEISLLCSVTLKLNHTPTFWKLHFFFFITVFLFLINKIKFFHLKKDKASSFLNSAAACANEPLEETSDDTLDSTLLNNEKRQGTCK